MDSKILSQLVKELLIDNDRVSLPGIGSFIAEFSPAYFSEDGITINPPYRKVIFKSAEIWNDGLIEKLYAENFKLDEDKATKDLEIYFAELKKKAEAKKSIVFPGIGKLRSTMEGNLFFTMDENANFNAGLMGLASISLNDFAITSRPEPSVIKENKPEAETQQPAVVLKKVKSRNTEVKASKRQRRTIMFLNIFVSMLILVLLVLIFREEVASLMESILYTQEEMELLKQWEPNSGS